VYERAKHECRYDAKVFRTLVVSMGGVPAAKRLIKAPREQSGFEKLCLLGRHDITMERRMLKLKFADLFEPDEIREARTRLERAGYDMKKLYEDEG
jgi:hypothetical protein